MTCLVGLNLNEYAIIAADKMEVEIVDGEIVASNNAANKITITEKGVITGSGYAPLLEDVKGRVASSYIYHSDQILEIIMEERDGLERYVPRNDENEHIYLLTSWLFTYHTIEPQMPNVPIIRVCMYHPPISDSQFITTKEGYPYFIPPSDLTSEQAAACFQYLIDNISPIDSGTDFNEGFSHNIRTVLSLIGAVSKMSKYVSPNCDVCVIDCSLKILMATDVCATDHNIDFVDFPPHSD
jgi:hypothetical protein